MYIVPSSYVRTAIANDESPQNHPACAKGRNPSSTAGIGIMYTNLAEIQSPPPTSPTSDSLSATAGADAAAAASAADNEEEDLDSETPLLTPCWTSIATLFNRFIGLQLPPPPTDDVAVPPSCAFPPLADDFITIYTIFFHYVVFPD